MQRPVVEERPATPRVARGRPVRLEGEQGEGAGEASRWRSRVSTTMGLIPAGSPSHLTVSVGKVTWDVHLEKLSWPQDVEGEPAIWLSPEASSDAAAWVVRWSDG